MTEDNARVSENPFFFCTLCYKRFNFKVGLVTLRGIGHICHRFNRTDSNTSILQRNVVGLLLHQMIKYQSFPPSGFRIYCISKLSTKPLGKLLQNTYVYSQPMRYPYTLSSSMNGKSGFCRKGSKSK